MAKELKQIIVKDFEAAFEELNGCLLLDYHGLNAEQTLDLRVSLRECGARMKIVQNRLFRHAISGREDLPSGFGDLFRGPVAVLYGNDTPATTKAFESWSKRHKGVGSIKGGLFEGRVLDEKDVEWLASLPDKPTLQSQVAGGMLGVLSVLASAADSVVSHFAGCVKSQAEGGGD